MPITQDRMIEVIKAGLDYRQALRKAITLISEAMKYQDQGQALLMLETSIQEGILLLHPMQSSEILSLEDKHYTREFFKNQQKRQEALALRRAKGVKPKRAKAKSLLTMNQTNTAADAQQRKIAEIMQSPLAISLRQQFPNMEISKFIQIVKEAEASSDLYDAPEEEEDLNKPLIDPNEPD